MVNLANEDEGRPLPFQESTKYQQIYKKNSVDQFLNLYKKAQNYTLRDQLNESQHPMSILWGDEIESQIVKLDQKNKKVTMVTETQNFFKAFEEDQDKYSFSLQNEYGSYQLETTPKLPFCTISDLSEVLNNIKERNQTLSKYLSKDEKIINIPIFPLYGQEDLIYFEKNGNNQFKNQITQSQFIDDRLINNHPFFHLVTSNGVQRIGNTPEIKIPIYKDINTNYEVTKSEPYPGYIYMDSAVYGAACCLQSTFTAKNLSHARRLYDQMSILGPLYLSMTAATPIHKGYLAETDTKWQVLAQAFDYRTKEEQNPDSNQYTPKSRWEAISYYISDEERNLDQYNDSKPHPLNEEAMNYAQQEAQKLGLPLDEKLTKFLGFLFYKDALGMFEKRILTDNTQDTTHFNHMQAMGLHSMRLRPPPTFDSKIGWRVEFRTGDIQLTDEENAAFNMLTFILARLFYESDQINFYIPITLVEENYNRSQKMDSILKEKFYFRKNIFDQKEPQVEEMTINEIFFGKEGIFEGLHKVSLQIWRQMELKAYGKDNMDQNDYFNKTFKFIKEKLTGERLTMANWTRQQVLNHPDYKKDSRVSDKIAYDLINKAIKIAEGQIKDKNFSNIF